MEGWNVELEVISAEVIGHTGLQGAVGLLSDAQCNVLAAHW